MMNSIQIDIGPLEHERRAKMFLRVNKRMDLFVPGMTQSQAEQAFNSCPPAEGVTPYSSRRRTGS